MSTRSEQINELAAALAKAQGEMTGAIKDTANLFFKSKYADLAAVLDACRNPLSKNGLAVTQTLDYGASGVSLVTTLMHSSGQWTSSTLPVNPVKDDPQGLGSCITYMRRYALAAIVGVAQVDDDGHAASGKTLGAHPEQPGPNDGQTAFEEYRIPRHLNAALAGKAPSDADPALLRETIKEVDLKYKGKIMPAGAVAFIKNCEPVVARWERGFTAESPKFNDPEQGDARE